MNQTMSPNTQAPKLDNFRNIEKMGLESIIKNNALWNQVDSVIKTTLETKEEGKDLSSRNEKLWHKVIEFAHDFRILRDLKTKYEEDKLKTIYTKVLSTRSDREGNHAQIQMYYGSESNGEYTINNIVLRCLDAKDMKNGWVYTRHGGNYSFTHDLVSSLNYFLFGDRKSVV